MNQNKNLLKIFSFALFIAFSIFCYCYLNFITPHNHSQTEVTVEEKHMELDQEDNEIFFPDVKLFSKAVKAVQGILEVI